MSNNASSAGSGALAKIKGFIDSKLGELIIFAALSVFALLFNVIFYSIRLSDYYFMGVERDELTLWNAAMLYIGGSENGAYKYVPNLNIFFIIAFVLVTALYIVAALLLLFKNNKKTYCAASALGIVLCLATLIIGIVLDILRAGAIVCGILSALFSIAVLAFAIVRRNKGAVPVTAAENGEAPEPAAPPQSPERALGKKTKITMLVCACAALLVMIATFFFPLCYGGPNAIEEYVPVFSLGFGSNIFVSIIFVVMFLAAFAELICFVSTVIDFLCSDRAFVKRSRTFVMSVLAFTAVFFAVGYAYAFFLNVKNKDSLSPAVTAPAGTTSYVPLIAAAVVTIVYSVMFGLARGGEYAERRRKGMFKLEPLIGAAVVTAITFASLALNIVKIDFSMSGHSESVALSGYKLLAEHKDLAGGFQVLAFIEFAVLIASGVLLLLSLSSFFAKDKNHFKIVKISAFANFFFVLAIGLFGIYFDIAQKVNQESLASVIKQLGFDFLPEYEYDVSSQTIYMTIASFAAIAVMMFRGVFGLSADEKTPDADAATDKPAPAKNEVAAASVRDDEQQKPAAETAPTDFDPCPAFTELDGKRQAFGAELDERRKRVFAAPSLYSVVRFVVDYARECRLHLSYSLEDMATFVAGMGASRLAILQGMSGTGKTSLPKIFTEAIMGNCEIVEVESSWRDKNELLGYYNEFSKCYTPKKFTQCLYKARLNPSVLTFIVLDEMNLSRIEYYFSDFLSLMEHEEHKREIKLLNVELCRIADGRRTQYDGLVDGHTIKIPPNVWFIGTANRDESTFEISDKVYDRAQTMNFNKRAPKVRYSGTPLDNRFLAYDELLRLFAEAKNGHEFDAENNAAIRETEKLLAPYNISFGNRILRQMEDFVKIYCACFDDRAAAEGQAVERILLSKVVCKLENKIVENKEKLASAFDKLGLKTCGEFVRKLNED